MRIVAGGRKYSNLLEIILMLDLCEKVKNL